MRTSSPARARAMLVAWLFLSTGCVGVASDPISPPDSPARISDGWLAMGTFFEADLRVSPLDHAAARDWLDEARLEIARLERIYSRHDAASEVSRLNRALSLGDGRALSYSDEMRGLFDRATEIYHASEGRFDPTMGPLGQLWQAAADGGRRPTEAALRRARDRVGLRNLERPSPNTVRARQPGMLLDWDGISKGDVLDRLRARFNMRFPGAAALLSLGESSLVAIGSPNGEPGWRLVLRSERATPAGAEGVPVLLLRDRAMSMSSSIGRTFEIQGRRYSHLIDPLSGEPLGHEADAVVIADSAAEADAWSTALLLRPDPRAMLRQIESRGGIARVRLAQGEPIESASWSAEFSAE